MLRLRILTACLWLVLIGFTAWVLMRDGPGPLLPTFFGAIGEGHWPGQFNADFLTFLVLSGVWTAWRGGFTPASMLLGVVAFFIGGGFLLAYLFVLTGRHRDDPQAILLGVHSKGASPT